MKDMQKLLRKSLEREIRRLVRYKMNEMIDRTFHPKGMWVQDFLAHYIVEKATGLPDRVIFLKALKYYRFTACR